MLEVRKGRGQELRDGAWKGRQESDSLLDKLCGDQSGEYTRELEAVKHDRNSRGSLTINDMP